MPVNEMRPALRLARPVLAAAAMIWSGVAFGQSCTITPTNMAFGNVAAGVLGNVVVDTTSTISISCTTSANTTFYICVRMTNTTRNMASGVNLLSYNIYQDAARTVLWGTTTNAYRVTALSNASGNYATTLTAYGRIFAGQQTDPAGTYSQTFTGGTNNRLNASTSNTPCSTMSTNSRNYTFAANATIQNLCLVTATDLDFGSTGLLTANRDATNAVSTQCTRNTPFTVALDGGATAATDPTQRQMSLGPNRIRYGIWRDAPRTLPWGTGANALSGTGTGLQVNNVGYGRIAPQTTPPAGAYADTITVTVTY